MKTLFIAIALTCCFLYTKSQSKVEKISLLNNCVLIDNLVRKEMEKQHIFGLSLGRSFSYGYLKSDNDQFLKFKKNRF